MDRKLISRRIGSILDDISRLSNALYAMDTTDIQRYPDNYETLSTDAALRAERIACRLRHLIYSSTTIRKGDYLKSASVMHGINITYENEVLAFCQSAGSGRAPSFCWTPSILPWSSTPKRTLCLTTGNVLSASPRYMTRRSPPGGCVTMTIWRKSRF